MKKSCAHLGQITDVKPNSKGCEDCLKIGGRWVHLRLCKSCEHVGCCDSSTKHAIVQSLEPGEDWMWCYEDEALLY
jgi:hypothetical protein